MRVCLAALLIACGASTPEPTTTPDPQPVASEPTAELEPAPRYSGLTLGFDGACVVDGSTPVCWGDFFEAFDHAQPRRIGELEGAREVALSSGMTACALMRDARVSCFGSFGEDARFESIEREVETLEAEMSDESVSDERVDELERQIAAVEGRLGAIQIAESARDVVVYDGGGCVLTDTVRCWDEEDATGGSPTMHAVEADGDVLQIEGAGTHRCLLQADGRIRCWGYGDGLGWIQSEDEDTHQSERTPASHAVEIAVGEDFTCYRKDTGAVACWGAIEDHMGIESDPDGGEYVEFEVPGVVDATRIVAGDDHACAIVGEGRVLCWGDNSTGALGNGTTDAVETIVEATGLSPARELELGQGATCALVGDAIRCVGSNRYSVFGSTPDESPVLFPERGTRVLTPGYRTCVETNGELRCTRGQLARPVGDNIQLAPYDPEGRNVDAVEGYISYECALRGSDAECGVRARRVLPNVSAVSVGTTSSCVLERNRRVTCWRNRESSADRTDLLTRHLQPTRIPGVERAQSLDVGDSHACVVRTDGRVTCWGDNTRGLIQDPAGELTTPVELEAIRDAVQVNLNRSSTCVRMRDQTVNCRTTSGWRPVALTNVVDMVARGYQRYLLTTDHEVYRLHGGSLEQVELPAEIVEISAGTAHACARARDGRVWCWGVGDHGELGVLPSWIHLEPLTVEVGGHGQGQGHGHGH